MAAVYYCGICGKKYDKIEDRIACETKCLKEQHNKEVEAEKAAKNAEAMKAINSQIADWVKMYVDICDKIEDYYKEFEPEKYKEDGSKSTNDTCNEGCKCKEGEENALHAIGSIEDVVTDILAALLED